MADFDLFSLVGTEWLPTPSSLPVAVSGLSDGASALTAALLLRKYNKKGIFIADNKTDILKISALFCAILGREAVLFPECDFNFDTVDSLSGSGERNRLLALEQIQNGDFDIVITTVDALCMPTPRPANIKNRAIEIKTGDIRDIGELCIFLSENGYSQFDMVEGEGSFSRRGGILDVFVPGEKQPVRIEFFDDEIERMSYFDVISQRRDTECPVLKIIASSGAYENTDTLLNILKTEYENTKSSDILRDIESLENGRKIATDKYIPLVYPEIFTLFDYIDAPLVFVSEIQNIQTRYEFIDWQFDENVKHCIERGIYINKTGKYYLSLDTLKSRIQNNTYLFSQLEPSVSMPLSSLVSADVNEIAVPHFDGADAVSEIESYMSQGYTVIVTVRDTERLDAIKKILIDREMAVSTDKIIQSSVNIVISNIGLPIAFNYSKLVLIPDAVSKKRAVRSRKKNDGERIKSFDDITPGDLVVHHSHGIGVYRGIKQITTNGVTKDYIVIGYDKGDTLYVPCPQLDLISKYIGGDISRTKLSRLGSPAWEKAKNKVREESRELARELIELYARRLNAEGFAFSPDTEWQSEFEQRFEYEETEDQLECVKEIKRDMERPYPMDRLLCGDVGVGKTEVALRAAFKAVMDGKQVAVLVPTTILATQHYNTILNRFKGFPVTVALMSRFKSRAEQIRTVDGLLSGEVDIVVGTHRLLQKDIKFKDLGLLIVDEEQRFGVKHKDKIKELAIGVDVLTMSATPIPRTLNMAMSGIRDISIIEEPPAERLPVMTYVLEYDFNIIEQAILREIRRNGCVFYLKNDIEALESISERIHIAIPSARIAVAHGKMTASEIEKTWLDVCEHRVDILLCTTIIETGIDVAFANTLIIEDADRMGLAQLHQIRGRVGRSSKRAYAYLTYRKDKTPSEVATKRLVTIKEFTEFGAGLKIAMRDLEIRGAGSLLGERQHGNMSAVGYDTYMDILKNVILTEQGKSPEIKPDCTIDISISAYIPENYITSERTRIDIYKKIAAIDSEERLNDVAEELRDRFSLPPLPVKNLMRISYIRNKARKLGISDIKQRADNLVFYFSTAPESDIIEHLIKEYKNNVLFTTGNKPYITVKPIDLSLSVMERMEQFLDILEKI